MPLCADRSSKRRRPSAGAARARPGANAAAGGKEAAEPVAASPLLSPSLLPLPLPLPSPSLLPLPSPSLLPLPPAVAAAASRRRCRGCTILVDLQLRAIASTADHLTPTNSPGG